MPRPICVHCNQPYGHRHTVMEAVHWPDGKQMPPYSGNMRVISERYHGKGSSKQDVESVKRLVMITDRNRADIEKMIAELPEVPIHTAYRTLWDGETWTGGYNPFCTLRCALAYARAAYAQLSAKRRA